jgi:putative hydrolase of HD superfamily
MQTKNSHSRKFLTKKTHEIIELFFEFAQLKNLYRQGWLERGIKKIDCESVAEHSFTTALLGYIIAEEYLPKLDSKKVMLLGIFHDLSEIYAGDITPTNIKAMKNKSALELNSIKKIFSGLPKARAKKYVDLWLEYENQKTSEAQFVLQIDKLEMVLQAHLYEQMYSLENNSFSLEEFFESVKKRITLPETKAIFEELLSLRK